MTRLCVHELAAGYGRDQIVRNISLELAGGQFAALVGPNGSGKSTLLKALAGVMDPMTGGVLIGAAPVGALAPRERARRLAYMPPDGASVWPLVARRAVALGRIPHLAPLRDFSQDDQAAIVSALQRAGVFHLAERRIDTLSSGERARVMLARVLATGADILLLDEPTSTLDPRHQLAVMDTLKAEADRGAIVIVAAHALDLVARYCDHVVLLEAGQVFASGPPDHVLTEAHLADVFGASPPGGVQRSDWVLKPGRATET